MQAFTAELSPSCPYTLFNGQRFAFAKRDFRQRPTIRDHSNKSIYWDSKSLYLVSQNLMEPSSPSDEQPEPLINFKGPWGRSDVHYVQRSPGAKRTIILDTRHGPCPLFNSNLDLALRYAIWRWLGQHVFQEEAGRRFRCRAWGTTVQISRRAGAQTETLCDL